MATAEKSYDIADIGLADLGQQRIEWADRHMPVLRPDPRAVREREAARRHPPRRLPARHDRDREPDPDPARGRGGRDRCAPRTRFRPRTTSAAALVDRYGASVYAINGEDNDTYYSHIAAAVDARPQITMDDGADVVSVLHGERTDVLGEVIGGTEETTTGVIRLKALEAEGKLGYPIVAVNDAITKHFFDNRYGTGQSTLDGIIRATNVLIAGMRVVVIGYGMCGKGVAMRAKGHGAHVIVCEVDPLRALEALMDGFEVMKGVDAAEVGDVFVSVTGNRDAISGDMFKRMKSGAIVCNSGHFDVEINKGDLDDITEETVRRAPLRRGPSHQGRAGDLPARRRAARQPRRGRGTPGRRDGHELRQPGARRRVHGQEPRLAREEGLPGAG